MLAEFFVPAAAFVVGLGAGFINVIVGSGSSIMVPMLMFLGLPPHTAIGTNRFAMLFNNGTGAIRYWQSDYLDLRTAIVLSGSAVIGATLGAFVVLETDPGILRRIVAIILIAEALVVLLSRESLGITDREFTLTKRNVIAGSIAGFIVGLYGGFVGMAMTSIFIFVFVAFFGLRFIKGAAIAKVLTFMISLTAAGIFLANVVVDVTIGITLAAAYIIGAAAGVHSAIQMGDKRIKMLFIVIVGASALKLLFS